LQKVHSGPNVQSGYPSLIDSSGFQDKIEEIISLILTNPKTRDFDPQSHEVILNMKKSIFYMVGFIEDQIYPGITKRM
jgi:hypothetical protein